MTSPDPVRPPECLPSPLELLVYAPIGLAAELYDRVPELVRSGRRQAEQRVQLYRFVGRLVVQQGQHELKRRIDQAVAERQAGPTAVPGPAREPESGPADTPPPPRADVAAAPSASDLPIADYDSLAAAQVVARLDALRPMELTAIEAYEGANRRRRTVLGRISQLQGA